MIYLKKGVYIAASSAVFVFFFLVGSDIRNGQDYSGAGVRGIVRVTSRALELAADLVGHTVLGTGIMGLSLFGGIYAAIFIWRDDWLF